MSDPKVVRYRCVTTYPEVGQPHGSMLERSAGECVRYSDYEALAKRVKELGLQLEQTKRVILSCPWCLESLEGLGVATMAGHLISHGEEYKAENERLHDALRMIAGLASYNTLGDLNTYKDKVREHVRRALQGGDDDS